MADVAILADDLTGAADTAVAFSPGLVRTVVLLEPPGRGDPVGPFHVVAVDTDSRRLDAGAAWRATDDAVRWALAARPRVVFKKVDSTLRGQVAAEVAAALAAVRSTTSGVSLAVVAPAFPGTGRTTRNGWQLVGGVPVSRAGLWQPADRPRSSNVVEMLGRVGLRCAQLDLSVVRQSPTALALHLDGLGTAGIDAVVCDADTGEDLGAIAAAATRMASRAIWVGSGGLAKELARVMAFGQAPESSAPLGVVQAGSIVTVVGSRSRVAHEQVRYLHTCPAVELISVSTAVLLGRADTRGWRRACAALQMAVDSGRDVVLSVTAKPAAPPDHLADERLTVALGALVSSCVTKPAGLILTGGETARAVLRAGGVRALRIRAETAPGIVLSTSERFGSAHGWSDIPVMTKAGAFGGADALASCRAELRAQSVAAVASQPGES